MDAVRRELARAETARGEVVLRERIDDGTSVLELRVNGVFVMDTAETTTEQALADVALAEVPDPRNVLVGGLGLGYTAHAVLGDPRVERVDVVEVEDAVVGWMRDGTIPHGPALLADARLRVVGADIVAAIAEVHEAAYDLILLDVDNGPGYLVHDTNRVVYEHDFLRRCRDALLPDGVLAVWSAASAPDLLTVLTDVVEDARELPFDVHLQGRAEQYHLYVGRR